MGYDGQMCKLIRTIFRLNKPQFFLTVFFFDSTFFHFCNEFSQMCKLIRKIFRLRFSQQNNLRLQFFECKFSDSILAIANVFDCDCGRRKSTGKVCEFIYKSATRSSIKYVRTKGISVDEYTLRKRGRGGGVRLPRT